MAEIMPPDFEPRRRGRKPNYDLTELLRAVDEAEQINAASGRWMRVELHPSDATSAKRQLENKGGFDVSLERAGETTLLYIRRTT